GVAARAFRERAAQASLAVGALEVSTPDGRTAHVDLAVHGVQIERAGDFIECDRTADARRTNRSRRSMSSHDDCAADVLRIEIFAPHLRANLAAHRLQALLAAHVLDSLRGADGIDHEGALTRHVHREIGRSAVLTPARPLHLDRGAVAVALELDRFDFAGQLGAQLNLRAVPA